MPEEESKPSEPSARPPAWLSEPRGARPELLRLSWPIAISMISYAVMTLSDTLFVGRLGPAALAGVGLGGVASFTLFAFPFGLLRGSKVLVSQARGAGRDERIPLHIGTAVAVGVSAGALVALVAVFASDLLHLIAATPASGNAAASYMAIRCASGPFVMSYVALRETRYGVGDSRSPMVSAVVGNAANIGLDALFILGFEWGVEGAALATVIAHALEVGLLAGLIRHADRALPRASRRLQVSKEALRELWDLGLPTGVQFLLEVGSFTLLASMLASISELEMASHQIAIQVVHFTFLPALAVGEAASVLAGQAVGARRDELVPTVAREGGIVVGAYAVFCTLVLVVFARPIASAFTDDVELATSAMRLLWVAAVFQIADAANIIAASILRGVGDVRYAAMLGIGCAWVCTPPLTWLLGVELGLGALGGWIGLCAEITACAILLWRRLRSEAWKHARTPALVAAAA